MRSRTKAIVAAFSITALAVVGMDAVTYAGTGDSLILGHANNTKKTTHIKTTGKGPALSLHAKGKRPALAVDSKTKIVKLNADRVDGKHASALQTRARVYIKASGSFPDHAVFKIPRLPQGTYQVSYTIYMAGLRGTPSDPVTGQCFMFDNASHYANAARGVSTQFEVSLSGSAVWSTNGRPWWLDCNSNSEPWEIRADIPLKISFLRIDKKTTRHLTATRGTPDAAAPLSRP